MKENKKVQSFSQIETLNLFSVISHLMPPIPEAKENTGYSSFRAGFLSF